MTEPIISCPNCRAEIRLTESLAAPLIKATREEFENKLADKEAGFVLRERLIRESEAALRQAKASIAQQVNHQVNERLAVQRTQIAAEESTKARALFGQDLDQRVREIAELREILSQRDTKLHEAQNAQADLLKKKRELDDEKRELELTIETRVQSSLDDVRGKARQEAEGALQLRVMEKEQQIASMARQIEDLKRKAEQGSQQLQGEVLELQIEALLRAKFPTDFVEPVPKGEFGGDVLQRVVDGGRECGTILWELKRTKTWSDGWLAKLRDDRRTAEAEVALLVSQALPKGVETFDLIDGVWVAETRCAIPVAIALRQSLIQIANTKIAVEGQQSKMELVYTYLTGPRFRHRIEAIIEKFSDMKADLEKERKIMIKAWAKRETQIHGVLEATFGMYGDLQAIAGRSLQELEGLDPDLIEGPESNADA